MVALARPALYRGRSRLADQIHHAGPRHVGGTVETRAVRIGACRAVPGEQRVDDRGLVGPQLLEAQPEAFEARRCEVRDEDIGPRRQARHDLASTRLIEVQRDRALPAVVLREAEVHRLARPHGAVAAVDIAVRRLDLDHVGAQVGHHRRARRRGEEVRHLEHPHPIERSSHRPPPSRRRGCGPSRRGASGMWARRGPFGRCRSPVRSCTMRAGTWKARDHGSRPTDEDHGCACRADPR